MNSESTNITSSEAVASKGSAQVSVLDSKSSDSSSDFKLGNDISADKADFTKRFKAAIPDMFSYYQPSDAEMNTFIQQYIQANAKRSQISVKVTEFYPTSAKVTVSSKVIDIGAVDTDTLVDEYLKQLTGKTYTSDSKLMADAEKYIFTNLYTRFPTTAMTTQTSEDDLIITYDDKKWTVDSSDSESNYGYSQLQRSMAGDLFY
nr:DUF5105 domain-containing protein [Streptococcus loxodontisalivarius]